MTVTILHSTETTSYILLNVENRLKEAKVM